jgi:biotin carboxyl carrier protein
MAKIEYRKNSLEKISSPDKLDSSIKIVTPKLWIMVAGIFVLLITVAFWGAFGEISLKIAGDGMLMDTKGVTDIVATSNGQIYDMTVEVGYYLRDGDILGRIDRPDLVDEINNYRLEMDSFTDEGVIKVAESKIKQLQNNLYRQTTIVAPLASRVVEIKAKKGDYVEIGQPIATVQNIWGENEIVLFVPGDEGKKLSSGMKVEIYPSNIDKEIYGYMEGRVYYISQYPSTMDRMISIFGNESLAMKFLEADPLEIRVQILTDSNTLSGYKWSTKKAKDIKVNIGTICKAEIILEKVAPFDLIFSRD